MFFQRAALLHKEMDEFCFSNRTRGEVDPAWDFAEQLAVIFGSVDRDDDGALLDP